MVFGARAKENPSRSPRTLPASTHLRFCSYTLLPLYVPMGPTGPREKRTTRASTIPPCLVRGVLEFGAHSRERPRYSH